MSNLKHIVNFCSICQESRDVIPFKDGYICSCCVKKLSYKKEEKKFEKLKKPNKK